ncbi:MAG: hypothetical protein ABSG50_03060 [Opitutaceae bacterium]|jgi:hypothetical protein
MDKPPSPNPPDKVTPAESLKLRQAREAQQKRNRDVGHMLKSGSFQQHMVKRSMPHVRGR